MLYLQRKELVKSIKEKPQLKQPMEEPGYTAGLFSF
jgi:hypothetical protein